MHKIKSYVLLGGHLRTLSPGTASQITQGNSFKEARKEARIYRRSAIEDQVYKISNDYC